MKDIENRLARLEAALGERQRVHVHGIALLGEDLPRCPVCDEYGPPRAGDLTIIVEGVDPAPQETQPGPLSPYPPPC